MLYRISIVGVAGFTSTCLSYCTGSLGHTWSYRYSMKSAGLSAPTLPSLFAFPLCLFASLPSLAHASHALSPRSLPIPVTRAATSPHSQCASGPRKCPDFPGFVTHAGRDFDGTDASQPALWDPLAAHAACRANPWCQGFNSKGHTKQIVGSLKSDSALCSYVRESSAAGGLVVH